MTRQQDPAVVRVTPVQSVSDLLPVLFETLQGVVNGRVNANVGRSVAYIAATAAKVAETVDLHERMSALEASGRRILTVLESERGPETMRS